MKIEQAFVALTGRKPSAEQKARLERLRDELRVGDNDAVWAIFLGHEYYLSLFERVHDGVQRELSRAQTPSPLRSLDPSSGGPPRSWLITCAACVTAGFIILFGSLCVCVGLYSASSAAWATAVGDSGSTLARLALATLRVPAGWMLWLLTLPLNCLAVRWGWQLRDEGQAIGWCIVGAALCLVALTGWLLTRIVFS